MVFAALLGFTGGAIAWWMTRESGIPAPPSAPHPAESAGLEQANATAVGLVQAGRPSESLPWFRRQFALMTTEVSAAHKDFASALHNAAAESGRDGPATRSSLERMALLRESLHHLDLAESLTALPAERAALLADRAHTLGFWGLPWDAFELLDRGAAMPGATAEVLRRARLTRATLEHPDAPVAGAARARG
jgi:hypothetical protein